MIFDTLQYVDGAGATQEVALNFSNIASGPAEVQTKHTPRSHAASEFQITWPLPPETALVIPFRSYCYIRVNRTSSTGAANSFAGGTILFQGRRWDNEGTASNAQVHTSITLFDAWKELEKITLQIGWNYPTGGTIASPTYTTFYWPDCVLFQPFPGATYSPAPVNLTITTWQQILDILNYATGFITGANAIQLQVGSTAEFSPLYCNWYPVRSMKCAEALTVCLRPHPGVYTEFDYSTSPPTIHFRNRANLTAVTLPYKSTDSNGIIHLASDIQPLNELVPDAVRLFYKINGTFNGKPSISFGTDFYPGGAANSLLCLDYSIDITGAATEETIVNFTSSSFDPTSLALWRKKVPALKQQSEGGQVPNDGTSGALAFVSTAAYNSSTNPKGIQVIDDNGNPVDYSSGNYEFIAEQDVFTWFQVSGAPVLATFATVKAFFAYDKITTAGGGNITDIFGEHEHHFRVLLTNAPTDTYILKQVVSGGEVIPSNLAQAIYTELADLQWKLRHEIIQVAADGTSVPTLIKPGKHKINLSGGATAWTTMNAVPENVSIQLFRTGDGKLVARHTIQCGPVHHLEPGYLIQLTNLFVNRNRSGIDAHQRLSPSSTASSQVDLSGSTARENSTSAEPVPVVTNNVYVPTTGPAAGTIAGQMVNSSKIIADILAATTPTPVVDATQMMTMQPREIKVCDDAGNPYYIIVHATAGHTKP